MANLPDLDTGNIGIISYWNAHDHRATEGATIDPSDVIDILDSYTIYDNGVDGTYTKDPRTVNVRVKNDGWIIAWIDRTSEYTLDVAKGDWYYNGYYDILHNWKDDSSNITSGSNTLIEVISDLYNDLSNSGDFNFYKEDVGTFCYEFPDAGVLTLASSRGYGATEYIKFTITSGTTLYYLALAGVTGYTDTPNAASITYLHNDTQLCSDVNRLGTYNVYGNDAYDLDTELSVEGYADNYGESVPALLAIWT